MTAVEQGSQSIIGQKSLADFQAGPGIPIRDQIILINNPTLFADFVPSVYPWHKVRFSQFVSECWNRKLIFGPSRYSILKGLNANRLFAGFFDHSFDKLEHLKQVLAHMAKRPQREFVLLIGKGDYSVTPDFPTCLPPNLKTVLANNVCVEDSRIKYLPMGRDFRSLHLFEQMQSSAKKTILCYCNFSTNTHPVRETLFGVMKTKPFVTTEHMGAFLKYSLTREQFCGQLSASKFCICPRGNAVDTFRLWDSLYVGSIPIVVREAAFHQRLEDLPILFLDSYDDYQKLDADFLEATYATMLRQVFDYDKPTAAYWLNLLD